ncbi:MAG: aldo/keto reductase [Verrucomicrobiales bacterium]|nr:aldo/keto reductase [Verrucomicrobiales bacterium]
MKKKRLLGTDLEISCLGLGTVKFGRNEQVKYPTAFDLPDDRQILKLLDSASESGINLLDTAPAYGTSEIRLGELLGSRRDDWAIVTKAGEEFIDGKSVFDFSGPAITRSVERTLTRLKTDRVEVVLLHSDGNDEDILRHSGAVEALQQLKSAGKIRAIGISTKTVSGGLLAVNQGLDAVMITYNPWHRDEEPVLDLAAEQGNCSVFMKKAFGSGWFGSSDEKDPVFTSLEFIFKHPGATSVITGTLNPKHLEENVAAMKRVFPDG